MSATSLQTMPYRSYEPPNFFNYSGHSPMMRARPQNNFLPYDDQQNAFMNPQLEYNMMNYMKHLNGWHNTQMAMGQRQMFYNQMAYQNFMGCIGAPFLRLF